MKYILTLVLMWLPAYAMAAPEVKINITAEKEVTVEESGKKVTKLVEADVIKPGDVVFYTLHYENKGDEAATDIALVDPIPENTSYINGTVYGSGAEVSFSIDGGKHYKKASLLTYVVDSKKQTASPEQYTHIRWLVKELGAGKSGMAGFKVRVK